MAEPSRALPAGTVAVLNTDIVGSTALGRRLGEERFAALQERHHALLRRAFRDHAGHEFKEAGDGFWVVFDTALAALRCAQACQEAICGPDAPPLEPPLRVRMAIHVANLRPDADGKDYHGIDLHDAARLLSASNGAQILLSEAAEAVLRHHLPDGHALVDRGAFLLRDAPGPQRLFEARWPTMPVFDLPPPVAPPVRTPSLPRHLTPFVGRRAEVDALTDSLTRGDAHLLTVTGLGGTGKTRLAIEAARASADRFAGAVWFVPLEEVDDPGRIPHAIAAALDTADDEPWDTLDPKLSGGPALLVLDNAEHLLDDGRAAHFFRTALDRWPQLALLVTSRQCLRLSVEQEYPLAPLPPEEGVALFLDRARRVRPDFALTERNADAVDALCRRLDGIPLAIELAAAWTRALAPADMLAQFPRLPQGRDRDLPERHRSLTAAIEGSYRLLAPEHRRLFRRLAAFRGGWSVAAAAAVCDEPDALLLLADLVDRSLVLADVDAEETRYQFLETIRAFAEEKLEREVRDEAQAVRERHAAFFAQIAAEAEPALSGADPARWLSRLATEHQNLAAALERLAPAERLATASRLLRYWTVRGLTADGRRWLADAADASVPDPIRIQALGAAGALALSAGDLDAAHDLFAQGRDTGQAAGDESAAGTALVNLAIVASIRGDLDAARAAYEASLPLWRRLGRRGALAVVLSNLGAVVSRQSDPEGARRFLEESLALQGESGDPLLRANTLHNLAEIAADQGDATTALQRLGESLHLRLQIEDRSAIANLILLLARIQESRGACEEAAWLYGAADAVCRAAQIALGEETQAWIDAAQTRLRQILGDARAEALRDEAVACTWDQAIANVRELLKTGTPPDERP